MGRVERLFSESPSRILIECDPQDLDRLKMVLEGTDFSVIGKVTADNQNLLITSGGENVLEVEIATLKEKWKNVLTPYY